MAKGTGKKSMDGWTGCLEFYFISFSTYSYFSKLGLGRGMGRGMWEILLHRFLRLLAGLFFCALWFLP